MADVLPELLFDFKKYTERNSDIGSFVTGNVVPQSQGGKELMNFRNSFRTN